MNSPASPRLPEASVILYSERYSYRLEASVEALVEPVRGRGYLTKSDLTTLGEWKSPRIGPKLARNSEELIRETTRLAFSTRSTRLAVHVPQILIGVGMPVSSTILHWFHPDPFPILDFRALWSMGLEAKDQTLDLWEQYVEETRRLAAKWQIDVRTLDRALWQYSYENQPGHNDA